MFRQGATAVVDPVMPERHPPPPPQGGTAPAPGAHRAIGIAFTMPRREVQYPPYRALWPPSPFRWGRRGLSPLPHSRLHAWEQRTRRRMTRCDPAPALRLWLSHVSHALPTRLSRSEQSLASVACALHVLGGLLPCHLCLEDILLGCFLNWTAAGADREWVLSALQRVPQGLAVSAPTLHEALSWRYGAAAPLWRSPRLHWSEGTLPDRVAPMLAPLWDLGPLPVRRGRASTPQAWTSAPQSRTLLVEGWDDVAEGPGGHWVGVTRDGTILCLFWGNRRLAMPGNQYAAAGAVLASISRVYAVWYAVSPTLGAPLLPPQHRYPRAGEYATARAWLAARELVWASRQRRRVRVVFHTPDPGVWAPGGHPPEPLRPSLPPCPPPPPSRVRVPPSPPLSSRSPRHGKRPAPLPPPPGPRT